MSERGYIEVIKGHLPLPRRFQIQMDVPEFQEWLKFGESIRLRNIHMDHATGMVHMTVEAVPMDPELLAEREYKNAERPGFPRLGSPTRSGIDPGTQGRVLFWRPDTQDWNWHR